ncbi:hypothetical protein Are01nite_47940 [Actinoplanes regularis]|nr:hypothetical protein Are01nite_47940 [Actinoplanes regularis]
MQAQHVGIEIGDRVADSTGVYRAVGERPAVQQVERGQAHTPTLANGGKRVFAPPERTPGTDLAPWQIPHGRTAAYARSREPRLPRADGSAGAHAGVDIGDLARPRLTHHQYIRR